MCRRLFAMPSERVQATKKSPDTSASSEVFVFERSENFPISHLPNLLLHNRRVGLQAEFRGQAYQKARS